MKSRDIRYTFRKIRTRKKIFGTDARPRLSVYRSLKHIYAQLIDDLQGKTLAAASSKEKGFDKATGSKAASLVGQAIAKRATEKGIKKAVFDRGARPYTGQVKALGEGARQGGLEF
jgi:large subunit ribosomal protein L18